MRGLECPVPIQIQPNGWSCYPTAVSMLTGLSLGSLIDLIGHDGSRIIYPDKPEPLCREAYCTSEMYLALLQKGWAGVFMWGAVGDETGGIRTNYPPLTDIVEFISDRFDTAILTVRQPAGQDHALAWWPKLGVLADPLTGEVFRDEIRLTVAIEVLIRFDRCLSHQSSSVVKRST